MRPCKDCKKAHEMVLASMEYVKVLGFRIRKTEEISETWKKAAQTHAEECVKLREQLHHLRTAAESGMLPQIVKERDALRAECDDLRRVFLLVHGSLGIRQGEHIGNAIEALKKERDELMIQVQDMRAEIDALNTRIRQSRGEYDAIKKERDELNTRLRQSIARGDFAEMRATELTAEIERLKKPARQHPVAVGEWVLRTGGGGAYPIGTVAQVNQYSPSGDYLVRLAGQTRIVTWFKENCTPCDPPEATHDTPEGKASAESAVKREPKPGDKVRLVREPSHTDIPAMLPWSKAFGMPGDTAIVVIMAVPDKVPSGTIPVRTGMGRCFFWPISCIEIVEDAK